MRTTLTPKQEAFLDAYLKTKNASEAYRQTYDVGPTTKENTINDTASKLLRHPLIAHRLATLAERRAWDRDRVIEELDTNVGLSRQYHQMGPSNRAVELIARITGILRDQIEVKGMMQEQHIIEIVEHLRAMPLEQLEAQVSLGPPIAEGERRESDA